MTNMTNWQRSVHRRHETVPPHRGPGSQRGQRIAAAATPAGWAGPSRDNGRAIAPDHRSYTRVRHLSRIGGPSVPPVYVGCVAPRSLDRAPRGATGPICPDFPLESLVPFANNPPRPGEARRPAARISPAKGVVARAPRANFYLLLFRPADFVETAESGTLALQRRETHPCRNERVRRFGVGEDSLREFWNHRGGSRSCSQGAAVGSALCSSC